MIIIGRHLGDEFVGIDAGVEDNHGDAFGGGALDHADHGFAIDGREADRVDAAIDHGVDDLQLAGIVGFRGGAVPDDLDAGFAAGGDGSGMDGLPEQVRVPFGITAMTRFLSRLQAERANRESARMDSFFMGASRLCGPVVRLRFVDHAAGDAGAGVTGGV